MAEAFPQITSPTPHYEVRSAASSDGIIIRPIPEVLRTWLPALVILFGMPLLALAVTKYALVPPMKRAATASAALAARATSPEGTGPVFYARLPLNVQSGFRSLALVGANNGIKTTIDQNKSKLMALASSEFKDTTVSDLDNTGALDAKRAQIRADFNRVLGGPVVQEVYIAEWPAQKP